MNASRLKTGLISSLFIILLFLGGLFEPLELMSYDARVRLSRALSFPYIFPFTRMAPDREGDSLQAKEKDSPVVLITIDNASLERLGQWPWPRSTHAKLVNVLSRAGARVIGFDIIFSEPDSKNVKGDEMLASASGAAGNVVYAGSFSTKFIIPGSRLFQGEGGIFPVSPLHEAAAAVGHIVALPDGDGVLRRLPVAVRGQQGLYFCFPLELARIYLGISGDSMRLIPGRYLEMRDLEPDGGSRLDQPPGFDELESNWDHRPRARVRIRGRRIRVPLDPTSNMLINYGYKNYGYKAGGYRTFPYYQVLAGQVPAREFDGKAVIIGVEAQGLRDFYPTPLSTRGEVTPGLRINALALETILSGDFIRRVNPFVTVMIIVVGGLAAAGSTLLARLFILIALAVISGFLAFARYGLWFDMAAPIAAMLASYVVNLIQALAAEERKRNEVRRTFERYVTPEAVREILATPGGYALGGSRRAVTILFADIRGFTAFAEDRDPEEIVGILNRYLSAMGEAVLREGGALDKFTGDGVMAVFGAPVVMKDHAFRAVKAALAILDNVERLGYGLQVGIGMATGEAVVGNIGTGRRMDYTAIGSVVNLASRLEELAGPRQILVDGATYSMIKGHESHAGRGDPGYMFITWESLGHIALRGRTKPLEVWRITGRDGSRPALGRSLYVEEKKEEGKREKEGEEKEEEKKEEGEKGYKGEGKCNIVFHCQRFVWYSSPAPLFSYRYIMPARPQGTLA
ncbi:MAG: adenylate/guanylate cyclase domain-containing protein [Firmicutes bacterium]|nr:adenylate/guanylate cyclase domain-containing protein [Bacillota bacterium]